MAGRRQKSFDGGLDPKNRGIDWAAGQIYFPAPTSIYLSPPAIFQNTQLYDQAV